ncbi:hypothetical protein [Botrimarina hoheduenensis]|uniref:Uncharacterized protein n=1 Tax=Botrimarina hoheduenensis TaxID=2528000 RepID=A0A5C5VTB9_9BACT|nr:hypothetical protein [Botrimarina hoheduenensis]TWT41377.1 hypothetical protein Pla111_30910 [Botrimarina hoheduenensis]
MTKPSSPGLNKTLVMTRLLVAKFGMAAGEPVRTKKKRRIAPKPKRRRRPRPKPQLKRRRAPRPKR